MKVDTVLDRCLVAFIPLSENFSAVFEKQETLPVLQSVLELAYILAAIGEGEGAVPVHFVVDEFANVDTHVFFDFLAACFLGFLQHHEG